jgi:hypothetical protein
MSYHLSLNHILRMQLYPAYTQSLRSLCPHAPIPPCCQQLCPPHPASAGFLKAAENQDLGLKIFSGDALADPMMVSLLRDQPSALKDLSVTTVNKGKNPFIKKFRATFPHVTYGSFAAQAYDAMVALLRAYAAAAPPKDGPAIAKQLGRERFEGEKQALGAVGAAQCVHAEQRSASHGNHTAQHSAAQSRAAQSRAAQCEAGQCMHGSTKKCSVV